MSRFDYSAIARTAAGLINKFGSPQVAVLPGQSQAVVAGKPWRGADTAGDTRVPIDLALVDYKDEDIDGVEIMRGDKMGLTSPPAGVSADLTQARRLEIDGQSWRVVGVTTIKPAALVLAHIIQVRR